MPNEILYGRQPVLETLRADRRRVYKVIVAPSTRPAGIVAEIVNLAQRRRIPVASSGDAPLDGIGPGDNHQGVAAEVSAYPLADWRAVLTALSEPPLLLLLDHIQDPQNVGAILRTADTAGVHAVIIPKDRAAAVTPAVVRASAGAAEHVQVCQVVNLHQTMLALKKENVWLAGLEALPEAQLYTNVDLKGPLGLVVGGEGQGLGRLVRETCDYLIRLPLRGRVGSLNTAVAAAIALYEIRRQRDG